MQYIVLFKNVSNISQIIGAIYFPKVCLTNFCVNDNIRRGQLNILRLRRSLIFDNL